MSPARFFQWISARAAPLVVAALLLVAAGAGRTWLYRCAMSGSVSGMGASCCCKKAASAAQKISKTTDYPRVAQKDCCQAELSRAVPPAASTKVSGVDGRLSAPLLATLAPLDLGLRAPVRREFLRPLGARAPPRGARPPLFALHCRYLI